MLNKSKINLYVSLIVIVFCFSFAEAGPYVAFSFNEAKKRINDSGKLSIDLIELGGITQPVGIVYDEDKRDVIIIGRVNEGERKITLDDFVVALRAIFKYKTPPLVSIDRTNETAKTGRQNVRFEGGIENTRFGRDLLEADVVLKKLGLGKITAHIWGIQSYFEMSASQWKDTGMENTIASRFWFRPSKEESYIGVRKGVAVVQKLVVDVKTEVMGIIAVNNSEINLSQMNDEIGNKFAMGVKANFTDITASAYYPSLNRLEPLFCLAGLAEGLNRTMHKNSIDLPNEDYWINKYEVQRETTPNDYPLLVSEEILQRSGKKKRMTIDGGIELKALILDLNDGVITAFRDIVVKSRPDGNILLWSVPLDDWGGIETSEVSKKNNLNTPKKNPIGKKIGMSLTSHFSPVDTSSSLKHGGMKQFEMQTRQSPLSSGLSSNFFSNLNRPLSLSPKIGGVMLSGVANLAGSGLAKVDLSGGRFSFVVDGKNARLSPKTFGKFITALWSTYYSNQDPGISIDPIAPGAKKHLVRYIGKVMNNDLGRVMREADYIMKKWSVGTERPDIRGFMSPDDYAARRGVINVGAWSRFWFVPEDMSFKQGGDMLLFDHGRMKVQTEYMFAKDKGSDPANEQFAQFFTDKYDLIAEKYPVYKELFEYAKVVSLAKYLKEKGIPLFWFLMANKDLVITEDSPGTVDALAKGSDYFKGVSIEGGVDLCSEEHYIYDKSAVEAIQEAWAKEPKSKYSKTSISGNEKISKIPYGRFTFDMGKNSYTVIPQHSLTSGKDRRGIRYQTDLAIRGAGFQLAKESLAKLHDEIVYREIRRFQKNAIESRNLKLPLDENTYISLYREARDKAESKIESIFDGLKKLEGIDYKTEAEFITDIQKVLGDRRIRELKPLILKYAYYKNNLELVRYFNPKQREEQGEFGKGWHLLIPYRIKPSGDKKTQFKNVIIPEKMALKNLFTGEEEILTFNTKRYAYTGYVPESLKSSQVVGLFLMSDASYRLEDKIGNKFLFNQAGNLVDMIFSEFHHYHIDYLYGFTDAFETKPYRVRAYGEETVEVSDFIAPKRIKVEDVIHGDSEVLVYSNEGNLIGYKPENGKTSKYKILAPLTDTSFRLIDKAGNETSFDPIGRFDEMNVSDKNLLVKTITQGNNKIKLKYTINNSGKVIIAGAYLYSGDESTRPRYAINYKYDDEGRLYAVKRSAPRLAKLQDIEQKKKILAFKKK